MIKVPFVKKKRIVLDGVEGFMIRKVTKFGTSAKVSCPKEFLGKTVYLVIVEDV